MKGIVTKDNNFIRLTDYTDTEIKQIRYSFKKTIRGWIFKRKKFKKSDGTYSWDGTFEFVDSYNRISVGLWDEVNKFCKKFKYDLQLIGLNRILDLDFDEKEFIDLINDFFQNHPKIKPYDYQIEAAIKALKYKRNQQELATSAGKTLIFFMIFLYLKHKGYAKKILMIVPKLDLVFQPMEDFEDYNNTNTKIKFQPIHGGTKKEKEDVDIVIGTFQSLKNLPDDFYDGINCVFVDEAHFAKTVSIKEVLNKCKDAKYRIGFSGTLKEDNSAEDYTIKSYIGPMINKISYDFLKKNDYVAEAEINCIHLDYLDEEYKEKLYNLRFAMEGTKILETERNIVVESKKRLNYITSIIKKAKGNTIVLFHNVKDGYGKRIHEKLRNETTDREIYYIDGNTKKENREYIKSQMKVGKGKVLVASFQTYATGISIKNIHSIFLVESFKSDIIIRQSIGRGIRKLEGKSKVTIFDFVDDFVYNDATNKKKKFNYLYLHGVERKKIYKEHKYSYKVHKVKL